MPVVVAPGGAPSASDIEELIREIEDYLRQIPPGAPTVIPLGLPGAGLVLAGLLAAMPWWGIWLSPSAADEAARRALNSTDQLQRPSTDAQALKQALALNRMDLRALVPFAQARPGVSLGLSVMPSPSAVNVQQPRPLAHALALVTLWQRAHHDLVHGGLVDAQGRADGATAAAAAAAASLGVQTVQTARYILREAIPQATRELVAIIRQLRQAQQAANSELAHELERTAEHLAQRIGDLVRWLQTEALPDLEKEIRAERQARAQGDHALGVSVGEEADARTHADASILAELAPLVAWFGGIGRHTTEKVNRNEDVIDQLEHLDWSSLLAFTGVPALVALVTRLMPPVLAQGPRMLSALEGAAAAARGSL